MKNILKIAAAFAMSLLALGCQEEFNEITELNLARCLEPQNLSGKVDVNTGDYVTFDWDVNKDAGEYELVIYTDESLSSMETSYIVAPSNVPFTTRLTADKNYWFTVQAYRIDDSGNKVTSTLSNIAVYDGSLKTYAVKDNLFLEITGRSSSSISLAWSNEVSDYEEVTTISAVPVKGGDAIVKTLSSAEATAAAATIDGLDPSTEYQIVLFYMSASRGAVDAWTKAETGTMTEVSNTADLLANLNAGGEIYLKQSGSPYDLGSAKPAGSVKLVGELGADGSMPVVNGKIELTDALVESGATLYFESVNFDGAGANSRVVEHTSGAPVVESVKFVNCVITNYLAGLFYDNVDGVLSLGELSFDSCDIYNIVGSGGDAVDIRKCCEISTIKFVNNTIYDGMRTFVRLDAKETIKIGAIDFQNNTVKGIAVINDGNNQGLFALKVATELILKKNLFLYEDGGVTDEATVDKTQLVRDNTAIVVPTLTASGNYSYAEGKDFFKKVSAAEAGCTILTEDPCYNSKGNFFQLENQDLIGASVGASKWWISYVEKEEDLTQNVLDGAHTWNLQDATLFAGDVKNSRVRDELLLVGTEATPMNADGGINFLSAAVLTKKGVPTEGYASFKVNTPGSVDIEVTDGGSSSVVIALLDDNGFQVIGGVMASSNAGVQKVVIPSVSGEGTVYLYPTGAITVKQLAWSLDSVGGNKVLETPKPTVEPVTLTEGDETALTITWNAVDNAASYIVIFNKRAQDPQTETSFTVPAEDIAALKAGLYTFTVQALPADEDIYYTKSDQGAASFAIQPKGGGGEVVEVTKTWDFSASDWQEQLAAYGGTGTDITNWDLTYDELNFHSTSKSKYNTTYIQFGGKSGNMDRYFKFTAPEAGTLKITVSNTGGSEDLTRMVQVAVGEDVQSQAGGAPSSSPVELEYSIAAGEVIITAPNNGLRFYKIEYNYSYTSGGTTPVEYDWDFSASDWQEQLAAYGGTGTDITNWDLTYDNLNFHSTSKSKYNTTYIQFGGKSGDMDRYFKFTAPDQGTLKITASNTGGSEDLTRMVQVAVGDDVQSQAGGAPSSSPVELEFSIAAGEVIITAPNNGLRFYHIYYTNQ